MISYLLNVIPVPKPGQQVAGVLNDDGKISRQKLSSSMPTVAINSWVRKRLVTMICWMHLDYRWCFGINKYGQS
ncbi:MAG: hypothetical protein ACM3X1_09845, partial [Ignavibacteriales bacterium]